MLKFWNNIKMCSKKDAIKTNLQTSRASVFRLGGQIICLHLWTTHPSRALMQKQPSIRENIETNNKSKHKIRNPYKHGNYQTNGQTHDDDANAENYIQLRLAISITASTIAADYIAISICSLYDFSCGTCPRTVCKNKTRANNIFSSNRLFTWRLQKIDNIWGSQKGVATCCLCVSDRLASSFTS